MKKYILLTLMMGMLLVNPILAFPPPSPDQERLADEKVKLCESTNGIANKTYVGGCQEFDTNTGECLLDIAWGIMVNCDCPEGFGWNTTTGCIKMESISIKKQDNTTLYLGIGVLIIFIFAITFWKLRKK